MYISALPLQNPWLTLHVSHVAKATLVESIDSVVQGILKLFVLTTLFQSTRSFQVQPAPDHLMIQAGHLALRVLWIGIGGVQGQSTFFETLGGNAGDEATGVAMTSDDGIVVGGLTVSYGTGVHEVLLAKWWNNGTYAWSQTLGGTGMDWPYALTTTTDEGIIVGGYTDSFGAGVWDVLLAKYWNNGTLAWTKTLGGGNYDAVFALTTTDDGIAITGFTLSHGPGGYDILLAKSWNNGTLEWVKTFGGINDESADALTFSLDGGIIAGGDTNGFNVEGYDALIAKYWNNGTFAWAKTFGGFGTERITALEATPDGGVIAGGYTSSFGVGNYDFLISKWWNNGTLAWAKTLGGGGDDKLNALTITLDGDIVTGGNTQSFGNGTEVLLAKWWANGTVAWAKRLGGMSYEEVNALAIASDGSIIASGRTNGFGAGDQDFLLAKISPDGQMQDCNYLHNVIPQISDVTSTINITSPSITSQNWTTYTYQDWNDVNNSLVNPTISEPCIPITTTGVVTTGLATTGVGTTGVVTTGLGTTGVVTTGAATTGQATTGVVTTGRSTTGIATTGIMTTGTKPPPPGVTTTSSTSTGAKPPSRSSSEGLVIGISSGLGAFAVIASVVVASVLWLRRKNKASQETELKETHESSVLPEDKSKEGHVTIPPVEASSLLPSMQTHAYQNTLQEQEDTSHPYENIPPSDHHVVIDASGHSQAIHLYENLPPPVAATDHPYQNYTSSARREEES